MADINLSNSFTRLKSFEDESHLIRSLLQCIDCKQLYFYEFYEEIDWEEGNDPQYRILIPITSEVEAEIMSKLQRSELLLLFPRIQIDWPSYAQAPEGKWIADIPLEP